MDKFKKNGRIYIKGCIDGWRIERWEQIDKWLDNMKGKIDIKLFGYLYNR